MATRGNEANTPDNQRAHASHETRATRWQRHGNAASTPPGFNWPEAAGHRGGRLMNDKLTSVELDLEEAQLIPEREALGTDN
jgi:hypothetical protein